MSFYDKLKFDANGLIPAIIQEQKTGRVLMMAWMNRASLEKTIETGKTHFWSRSRQKFWMKGEDSGHTQTVKDIAFDCDGDTLLDPGRADRRGLPRRLPVLFFPFGGKRREIVQDNGSRSSKRRNRFTERRNNGRHGSIRQPRLFFDARCCWFSRGEWIFSARGSPRQISCSKAIPSPKNSAGNGACCSTSVLVVRPGPVAVVGHRRRHRQRAGGRAQFPVRLAHAFAGRGSLPRLARRARAGNARHALPVLPRRQHAADRRRRRGADLFQPAALLVPFAIGMGMVAYAVAVAFYTLLAIWRIHRAAKREARRLQALPNQQPLTAEPLRGRNVLAPARPNRLSCWRMYSPTLDEFLKLAGAGKPDSRHAPHARRY